MRVWAVFLQTEGNYSPGPRISRYEIQTDLILHSHLGSLNSSDLNPFRSFFRPRVKHGKATLKRRNGPHPRMQYKDRGGGVGWAGGGTHFRPFCYLPLRALIGWVTKELRSFSLFFFHRICPPWPVFRPGLVTISFTWQRKKINPPRSF